MLGKSKCKILKEIRQKIADENDIPYVTRECTYQGQCSGTCPRCEQELHYLEQQLALRQKLGKTVAVAALAAGIGLTAAGCELPWLQDGGGQLEGEAVYMPPSTAIESTTPDDSAGNEDPSESVVELVGEATLPELEGDIYASEQVDFTLGMAESLTEECIDNGSCDD